MKTKITNKTTTPVFAILALILFGTTIGTAAPGDLDTTFGNGGIVITRGNSINHLNTANAMAIQSDGKIVAVGDGSNDIVGLINNDFAVVRYNTDGSLDSSFGGTGIVITPIQSGSRNRAFSVAIQADGKIVVAGESGGIFALVRYNTDGSLDTSFNGTGKVITPVGNSGSRANELTIQADGKIVAVGDANLSIANKTDFALVRYNPNGSLDTTFGGSGKIMIPVGNLGDYAYSVAIQTDRKIVVAGHSYSSGNGSNITRSGFAVVRLNPNGSLDTTFNGTGKVITTIGIAYDGARSVAIQADGKIVVAGSIDGLDLFDFFDFAVVRYQGGSNANIRTRFDFDGDGRADVSVFRDGTWYLLQSTNGVSIQQFGLANDKPVPSAYLP